ncbi:MAG: hypothetical protein IT462_03135 [Planctomycetes bacterium]|nr:hypothetical protein [Planctomycetota bacterium]
MIDGLKIVGLCVLAAIIFGIAHDMVTAHVCVEYFSIGHRNIFGDQTGPAFACTSPTSTLPSVSRTTFLIWAAAWPG